MAQSLAVTPMQVALAWLLRRAPNILLIPGTSSRGHLRENLAVAEILLPQDAMKALDEIYACCRRARRVPGADGAEQSTGKRERRRHNGAVPRKPPAS